MTTRKSQRLLNEDTIRRMMKLANTEVLAENFMDRTVPIEEEEAELGEEPGAEAEPMMGADAAEPEAGMGAEAEVDEEVVEDIVSAVVSAISDVTGVEASVEAGAEGGEMAMGDEPAAEEAPMEEPAAEDDEAAMRDYAANRDDDEELTVEVVDDEDLTEAVLKRVVERLLRQSRK
jgi:ubiquinol-cytochrome c reductase cytochrome c1 subunit